MDGLRDVWSAGDFDPTHALPRSRASTPRHGVPSEAILVESEGESTVHSIAAAAEIMRRMNLRSCIVVSDGYHIYRVKKLLENQGMKVFGSPRPEDRVPQESQGWRLEWLAKKGGRTVTRKLPRWKSPNPEIDRAFHSIQHSE